jgi:hypothetical protein
MVVVEHAVRLVAAPYVGGHGYRSSVTMTRQALLAREGAAPQPAMREEVPDFVEEELRRWIFRTASLDRDEAKHALIRLGLKLPASYRRRYLQELEEARAEQARLDAKWQAERDAQNATESVTSWHPSRQGDSPARRLARTRFLAEEPTWPSRGT